MPLRGCGRAAGRVGCGCTTSLPRRRKPGQPRKPREATVEATKRQEEDHLPARQRQCPPSSRSARASAAAQAKALAEAQEPRFKTDENGAEVPDVRAEAAIIYNPENGAILWESNSQNQRSIASITKVMTAVVFLENSPDLDRKVVVDRSDVRGASTTYLRAGYTVTTNDLLHLTLIASDNAAATSARPDLALWDEGIHRSHEREGAGAWADQHQLRRFVRASRGQRVVRLRHGAD